MTRKTVVRRVIGTLLVLIVLGLTTCGTFVTSLGTAAVTVGEIARHA